MGVEDWRIGATQSSGLRGARSAPREAREADSTGLSQSHGSLKGVGQNEAQGFAQACTEPREPKYSFRALLFIAGLKARLGLRGLIPCQTATHTHTHTHARTHTQTHSGIRRLTEEPVPLSLPTHSCRFLSLSPLSLL